MSISFAYACPNVLNGAILYRSACCVSATVTGIEILGLYHYCCLIPHEHCYFKFVSGLIVFSGETFILICLLVK